MENDFIRPSFSDKGATQVFKSKAAEFGFIERYPKGKESVTKIAYEPWHFRYVGVPHAAIMKERHLTLEEYTEFIKQEGRFTCSLSRRKVTITYIPAEIGQQIRIETEPDSPYVISGNNVDGLILTQWRVG